MDEADFDFDDAFGAYAGYGRIVRNADGKIVKIVEVKDATEEEKSIRELNTGIYCFDANWLVGHIDELDANNAAGEFYLTDLIEVASGRGDVVCPVLVTNPYEGLGANTKDQLLVLEQFV